MGTRKKVLLVDDDGRMLEELAKRVKQKFRCTVDTTCEGREALRLARAHPYNLVITDGELEGMSGPELIKAIREDKDVRVRSTPIVLFSGSSSMQGRARDAGATDCFLKFFSKDDLGTNIMFDRVAKYL